jgi:uncharacterized protein
LYCDVDVKHAAPIAARDIADEAEELTERALADAVLVTGTGTGRTVRINDLRRVRERVRVPVIAASGVTASNLREVLTSCDGVIVGSALRRDGKAGAPLDSDRVKQFAEAFNSCAQRFTDSQSLKNLKT